MPAIKRDDSTMAEQRDPDDFPPGGASGRATPRDFVAAFAKGLEVIQSFSESSPALTLTDVSRRTGLSRAGARRFLLTLETLGFAERIDGRRFVLGPRLLLLGHAYLSSMPMWRFAEPVLETLVEQTGETCSLSVLDIPDVVYVLRIPVHRVHDRISTVGSRLPAHCTSMGRLLLAGLSDRALADYLADHPRDRYTDATCVDADALRQDIRHIRRRGYAWVSGEIGEAVCGLAVPIHDDTGKTTAALNVSVRKPGLDAQAFIQRVLPAMRHAAGRLSASVIVHRSNGPRQVRAPSTPRENR